MTSRVRAASVALGAAAVLLLVWVVRFVGVETVLHGFERLGVGFLIVLALGGVRHGLRALAWTLCFEGRPPAAATAFGLYVAGDAIGNVTPFGLLASEPSKILLLKGRADLGRASAALALENLFYAAAIVAMLITGTAALLWLFPVTTGVRTASLLAAALAALAAAAAAYMVVTRRRWFSASISAARINPAAVRAVEDQVFGFAAAHRSRLVPIALLELGYQAAAVAEIWIVLRAIGAPSSVAAAFVLECVNRVVTVAFQFVPMWIGVDEAGTGLMTTVLGTGAAAGVTLALVRKARIVVWTAVGLAIAASMRFASRSGQSRARGWRAPAPSAQPPAATASRGRRPSEKSIAG